MNRSIPLLLAGVAAAAVLAGCGDDEADSSSSPAATVNGAEISNQDLVAELEAIEGNDLYLAALEQQASAQGQGPIVVDEGEFDTAFVSDTLAVRIQYAIVTGEVGGRDLVPGDACVEQANDQLVERYAGASPDNDGQAVLDGFADDYRAYLLDRQSDLVVLTAELVDKECGATPTDDEVAAYLEANPELAAESACVSHILVGSAAEAAEIQGLLDGGADFAELAAERSTDSGSGAQGGSLGCGSPDQYVPAFAEAVRTQPVGEVGDPVETEFGFHIILVTDRGVPTAEELRPEVEAAIQQEDQQQFLTWFEGALAESEITIDPRFGSWDPVQATITPPAVEGTDAGDE